MPTILLATEKPFAPAAVARMRDIAEKDGCTLQTLESYNAKQQLLDAVQGADALIVRSDTVDSEVLNAGPNLKVVVRAGAGYDNLDTETARHKNIVCMNTPGQNANAVAEAAFGMMLYMARKQYSGASGTELREKTLGILGYGNIGRFMARIGQGFGMDIYAYKRNMDTEALRRDGVKPAADIPSLFDTCTYVSLHIPVNENTKGSIAYDLIRRLPQNGMLINTARLEIVNEEDLLRCMNERSDITYVTDFIPKLETQFKERFPKRIFYPPKKMGAQTEEANVNAGLAAVRQIIDFLNKGTDTFRVN